MTGSTRLRIKSCWPATRLTAKRCGLLWHRTTTFSYPNFSLKQQLGAIPLSTCLFIPPWFPVPIRIRLQCLQCQLYGHTVCHLKYLSLSWAEHRFILHRDGDHGGVLYCCCYDKTVCVYVMSVRCHRLLAAPDSILIASSGPCFCAHPQHKHTKYTEASFLVIILPFPCQFNCQYRRAMHCVVLYQNTMLLDQI